MQTPAIPIAQGYRPGVIGRIAEMHAVFYSAHAGFGHFFEGKVASGLAEFTTRLANPRNALWTALDGNRIVGSVAVDGEDLGDNTAHLRWFILDDGFRGRGTGRALLAEAVAFCDRSGFAATRLWTLSSLSAARKLYESFGFVLEQEYAGTQWGKEILEQVFTRKKDS